MALKSVEAMHQYGRATVLHVVNQISSYIKRLANEPSVGLHHIQEHVRKSCCELLRCKTRMEEAKKEIYKRVVDAEECRTALCTMNTQGAESISRMQASVALAMDALSLIRAQKTKNMAISL
mmetsp:Transcript_14326/g.30695  ORF Transcript_14326/g.30695 Transcript_14326/m.30695 type:complete len:122 (-) Transcript_14326:118-483(-)|eukprot:CAMPEP_0118922762 /NCGR_PEP_ID=MMETSP1169-20130426/1578_1 /TAXON_ID=36882 /ORGANISM="Pyramimonas obovata, Strain CCMP722" /LENGTH=121 /DNA_ID=CAMNT_0006863685 /DNA_START=176 /DNA_END=541 /DNA_ORIENTATION=+